MSISSSQTLPKDSKILLNNTCDRGCLNAISDESVTQDIKDFIESERRKGEQALLNASKVEGSKCPPFWSDVMIDGKPMCQQYTQVYGSCPPGYTSWGAKCGPTPNPPLNGQLDFLPTPEQYERLSLDNTIQTGFEIKNGMRIPKLSPNYTTVLKGDPVDPETAKNISGDPKLNGIISYT